MKTLVVAPYPLDILVAESQGMIGYMLAQQIGADGLVILTDADAVYQNWGTPEQRAIRHATPDELTPFAKSDGSMGPKVAAVSDYVRALRKPAYIGAIHQIDKILAGVAGTCISL